MSQQDSSLGLWVRRLAPLVAGGTLFCIPTPGELTAQTWHLLAIFVAAIVAVMVDAVPILVASVAAAALAVLSHTLTPTQMFAGFSEGFLLLIVVSFLIARGVINSGLGQRIAFLIISRFGHSSLGLAYSLMATDCLIAPAFPSNTARSAVLYPIVKSLSVDRGSEPDEATRRKLGAFLAMNSMTSLAISSTMWLTAMAANPTGVAIARDFGVDVTFGSWFLGALAPSLVAFVVCPYLLYRVFPPEVRATPQAPQEAKRALADMGPMTRHEWIMALTFLGLVAGWALSGTLGLDKAALAFAGLAVVMVAGVFTVEDIKHEGEALSTYVWFAILYTLSGALNQMGFMGFAGGKLAGALQGWSWPSVFAALVILYVVIHYFFVSQSAQVLALLGAFLGVGQAAGVPVLMLALMLLYATNFSSVMTPQASSANAIFVGSGYLKPTEVYRHGSVITLAALVIYLVVGTPWLWLMGYGW